MSTYNNLDDLLDHFDVPEVVWRAFETQVGSPGNDYRLLAALPKVALVAACGQAMTPDGALTPVQATQVGLVWRLARRIVAAKSGAAQLRIRRDREGRGDGGAGQVSAEGLCESLRN